MNAIILAMALVGQAPWIMPAPCTASGAITSSSFSCTGHVSTPVYPVSSGTATATIDAANGDSQSLNLASATGTVTVTLANFVAGDTLTLTIIQHASAPQTIAWTGGSTVVKWPGATVPTITATNSAVDEVSCKCTSTHNFNCVWVGNFS